MTTTENITTGTVDVGDVRLSYRERGTGAPVLLMHAGGFGEWFSPVFHEPALDGVRLVEIQRAGYGGSSTPEGHVTFADHARHARTLLREIGIDRATWVGHSSSASMALQGAIDAPEAVERLVLLEPAPSPAGPSAEELVRTAVGPAVGAAQAGDIRGATETFMAGVCGPHWADLVRERLGGDALDRLFHDSRFFLTDEVVAAMEWPIDETIAVRVTAPTTLVYGDSPATKAHEETTTALAAWIPGAELVALPGVGHAMTLEDPAAVARLVAAAM
ncbi:pimeloyl-ACP methyl ester carboxylesterase [Actinomycetospora succinea]|uniref:Pimeloyl-ACP methyl ester carboxylesterase n=1 Tax=Actinomycetospora succinea TaxID=663603 RepID=A0A4R6V5L2_9PSEU|nr:alpha/beta hydrolase [Actinomycetospora succinea]TDQ55775.1 pimeloyl-ACP methyl ester carboxylesterase [Actinomycetospora succinea]